MTTPDHLHRIELTFELPGTPEQVWAAIATGPGITSWFLPTDLEERVGGSIVTHMGETSSPGTVTGYEAPRRFAIEEPDWPALGGHAGAPSTPLATEFLIEANSGGTCVLRVVSSAYGTGAEWEQEFFAEMEQSWTPYFERLRQYLIHFPGQHATPLAVELQVPGPQEPVVAAMLAELGVDAPDQSVSVDGLEGVTVHVDRYGAVVRLTKPVPGFFAFAAWTSPTTDAGEGTAAALQAQLFSDDAATYIAEHEGDWKAWLERVAGSIPADR